MLEETPLEIFATHLGDNLKFAGLQNPLDAPHHLRRSEWLPYREGVVIEGATTGGGGCLVDCGLAHPVECLQRITPGTRVTLRLHPGMRGVGDGSRLSPGQRKRIFRGEAVSPQEPPARAESCPFTSSGNSSNSTISSSSNSGTTIARFRFAGFHRASGLFAIAALHFWCFSSAASQACAKTRVAVGLYWGYRVRAASCLRGVFSGHSLGGDSKGLYDCLLGTSERGQPLADVAPSLQAGSYKHLLVVFGGLQGLEAAVRDSQSNIPPSTARRATRLCLEGDKGDTFAGEVRRACRRVAREGGPGGPLEAFAKGETGSIPPSCLFDFFVNTCPLQASRTIRAEEALLVTLAALRQAGIHTRGPPRQQAEITEAESLKERKRKPHVPPLLRVMMELEAEGQQQ
ncbi:hypothetical protein ACSSS7_004336 [Eimeria intestinalis]